MKQKRLFWTILLLALLGRSLSCFSATGRCDSLHVCHYSLDLDLTHFQEKTLSGHALLQIQVKTSLSEIRLDLLRLQTDSVYVNGKKATFTHQGQDLRIALTEGCKAGDSLEVEVWYHGSTYTERFGGYYFSGDYTFNLGVAINSIPHCMGKSWFPCVDEFTDKATYTYRVLTHSDHRAACGGIMTDSIRYRNMTTRWIWEQRQPIPTYLASVATGPYSVYRDSFPSIDGRILPIQIYVHPAYFDKVAGSFTRLKSILGLFESCFGPYPFDRVGYVTVNFSSGAMEHAGNIAYPLYALTGDWSMEDLYAHELSHAWFGDDVTCERAEDMWLNEGFASWCEGLLAEYFSHAGTAAVQDSDAYRAWFRSVHRQVLLQTAAKDGGYYALDSIPQEHTYGSTVYDKGSLAVYNLRSYMGDSLFFHCMKKYLQEFALGNIRSLDFFRFLGKESGLPMEDCYYAWIAQPGFLHFSVDSICPNGDGSYRTYLRQQLHHADHYGDRQKVSVRYFFADAAAKDVDYIMSGAQTYADAKLPGRPLFTVVDWKDRYADAVIDSTLIFKGKKTVDFTDADLLIKDLVCDSQWVRLEHHLVAPDSLKTENPHIYRISRTHYWRILSTEPKWKASRLYFSYYAQEEGDPDYELIQGYRKNDYVLLYRPSAAEDWKIIECTQTGSVSRGTLSTGYIRNGEYCLGVGDTTGMPVCKVSAEKAAVSICPNPAEKMLNIRISDTGLLKRMRVFNAQGQEVLSRNIHENTLEIDVSGLSSGIYFIDFQDKNKQSIQTEKFIVK